MTRGQAARPSTRAVVCCLLALGVAACGGGGDGGGDGFDFDTLLPPADTAGGDTGAPDTAPADTATPPDSGPEIADDTADDADAPAEVTPDCTVDADCDGKVTLLPCQVALCKAGACEVAQAQGGSACDDGNPCTQDDKCLGTTCKGSAVKCDDGELCTIDTCDPATGDCVFDGPAADGKFCSDGDVCTKSDKCSGGVCQGTVLACDDGKSCTTDGCDPAAGICKYAPIPDCGVNHPCFEAATPGSADADVDACVCALEPACCETAWTAACADLAVASCGVICDCAGADPGAIACTADADCAYCDDADLCNGTWTCDAGACALSAPVDCSVPAGGCSTGSCVPETGACAYETDDLPCDDSDVCTADACDGPSGECVNAKIPGCGDNPACQPAPTPTTADLAVAACVCALAPKCCLEAWTVGCVEVAELACGVTCDCKALAGPLPCAAAKDCKFCDDTDLCTAPWACVDGTCQGGDAVVCDPAGGAGCVQNHCNPATGSCEVSPSDAACDDGDPCTVDACNANDGACFNVPIPGCGDNHPCQAAVTPASSDPVVTACVCDKSPTCCTEAWTESCVTVAKVACGQSCDCGALPAGSVPCDGAADCAFCDDGDKCNGTWACEEGACAAVAPPTCPLPTPEDCRLQACDPATGACAETGLSDAVCEDGDPCTVDVCDPATQACVKETVAACGSHHPCEESAEPLSFKPAVNDCVCGFDPTCCTVAWDEDCVGISSVLCGQDCTCGAIGGTAGPACADDFDCRFCDDDDDLCNGGWTCVDGLCQLQGPTACTAPLGSCATASCDPVTALCSYVPDDAKCDDKNPCTVDACSTATGLCTHEPLVGCGLQHPCQPAATPTSKSNIANSCVCFHNPACCKTAWDESCITTWKTTCNGTCDCAKILAQGDSVPCADAAACAFCDDADACNGDWGCTAGKCKLGPPVTCDPSGDVGCVVATCDPATGDCAVAPSDAACDDDDPCTADACDGPSTTCTTEPIPGCAPNDVCDVSDGPGANDLDVVACVCVQEPSCCDTAWTQACVDLVTAGCGPVCDCAKAPAAKLSCTSNANCAFCDDGDKCTGVWSCVGGTCKTTPPVVCDASGDFGCVRNACEPATGLCKVIEDDAWCDDGKPCTVDACLPSTGTCSSVQEPGCVDGDPCNASAAPGADDPVVEACVCATLPYCCSDGWDGFCALTAQTQCGQFCTCEAAPFGSLGCSVDADCASCDDADACNGVWSCLDGNCIKSSPVECDEGPNFNCLLNTCNPSTGTCDVMLRDDVCDDGNPCTKDVCDLGTVDCVSTPIPGCTP